MVNRQVEVIDAAFEGTLPAKLALGHAPDTVSLYWLGQAGFVLVCGEHSWLIDPYLSDSLAEKYAGTRFPHTRMMDAPISVGELPSLQGVFCTHRHTDHMDPGTLLPLFNSPKQKNTWLVAPRAEITEARIRSRLPDTKISTFTDGESLTFPGGLRVFAIPAAHEEIERDSAGNCVYLGYIFEFKSDKGYLRIWHSGDCIPYPELPQWLSRLKPDVALLPVNGRDNVRKINGVPGNFTLEEAVNICIEAGITHMVAHHVGLFHFNTENPARIAAYATEKADMICIWPATLNREYRLSLR
ncbi:MBL fold metallo-hydrolase [Parasalinivibrio latis]|uniref:MBL fold metallo-hydrolase n=1 Tax=Parasalinivibrio latis TaxID=2952610 RepID=UPI0030E4653A